METCNKLVKVWEECRKCCQWGALLSFWSLNQLHVFFAPSLCFFETISLFFSTTNRCKLKEKTGLDLPPWFAIIIFVANHVLWVICRLSSCMFIKYCLQWVQQLWLPPPSPGFVKLTPFLFDCSGIAGIFALLHIMQYAICTLWILCMQPAHLPINKYLRQKFQRSCFFKMYNCTYICLWSKGKERKASD